MENAFYDMHEVVQFTSSHDGPRLLVLGAIHGNEVSGTMAIRTCIAKLENGDMTLQKGSVTFVPVCNPLAQKLGKRYVEKNLNRVILHHDAPAFYEERLANNIVRLIDQCDWLLDLHSSHTQDPPFVNQDAHDEATKKFARCIGLDYVVTNWQEMYVAHNIPALMEGDTMSYGISKGIPSCLVECGYHHGPEAPRVAERAILNTLKHIGLIEINEETTPITQHKIIAWKNIFVMKSPGKFTKDWKQFDPVKKGDVVGIYNDGSAEIATTDGYMMLPNPDAIPGDEWFYLGVDE